MLEIYFSILFYSIQTDFFVKPAALEKEVLVQMEGWFWNDKSGTSHLCPEESLYKH